MADTDLGLLYRDTRARVADLVGALSPAEAATPALACPGWTVHDVVAHMAATADDVVGGRLAGPPDDEWTAGQVARHRDDSVDDLLQEWASASARFEEVLNAFTLWPGVIDVITHEHDIRGALGRPGGHDGDAVRQASAALLSGMTLPVPLVIHVEDGTTQIGSPDRGSSPLELTTTRFELCRWRMGRRSRAQLTAMDWSGDPTPVLDSLVIFGPATTDLIE